MIEEIENARHTLSARQVCAFMCALNVDVARCAALLGVNIRTINAWRTRGVSGPGAIVLSACVNDLASYELNDPRNHEPLGTWRGVSLDCAVASYLAFNGYDGRTLKMQGDRLLISKNAPLERNVLLWCVDLDDQPGII
jgi:hypothetical protein